MPKSGREDPSRYMHQLIDLVGDEITLRTLSRHVMKVFPDQKELKRIWSLLPTEYVTIPLQGAVYLGSHERKHGYSKKREVHATQLLSVMFRFCEVREGELLNKTTFNSVIDASKIPRFTQLNQVELYSLVEMSVAALKIFFMAKDVERLQRQAKPPVPPPESCTSQAHVKSAER